MNSPYRAVLIDLDGTLVNTAEAISDRTADTLRRVEATGVLVMIATGRSVSGTRALLDAVGLTSGICCYNGAVIVDADGEWVRQRVLGADVAADILVQSLAAGLGPFVYHRDEKFIGPGGPVEFRELAGSMRFKREVDCHTALPTEDVTRISIVGEDRPLRSVAEAIGGAHGGRVCLFPYALATLPYYRHMTGSWCDIEPHSRGKAEAVDYLGEQGVPAEAVVAIGDQANDLTMLDAAGLGVAMANAIPEAKATADRVIGHHDEDGVAEFLEELFL